MEIKTHLNDGNELWITFFSERAEFITILDLETARSLLKQLLAIKQEVESL